MPVQLEQWIKTVENKRSPYDLREISILHLKNVRDIIDKVIRENTREPLKNNTIVKDWKRTNKR
jgi:hypothetical protein